MWRILPALVFLALAQMALMACNRGVEEKSHVPSGVPDSVIASTRTIISLSPSITETIYAFGGGAKLLGVDRYSDQVAAAKDALETNRIRFFGDAMSPAREAIVAAKPKLILVEGDSRAKALTDLGPQVEAIPSTSLTEILAMWLRIGVLIEADSQAQAAKADFEKHLIAPDLPRKPRVLLTYSTPSEGTLYCVGANSYQSEILERLGGENVLRSLAVVTPTPQLSLEDLLTHDPDIIVTILAATPEESALSRWRALPALRAVKQAQVYDLAGSAMTFYGPTSLTAFTEKLRAALETWGQAQK